MCICAKPDRQTDLIKFSTLICWICQYNDLTYAVYRLECSVHRTPTHPCAVCMYSFYIPIPFPLLRVILLQSIQSTHTHTHTHTQRERERGCMRRVGGPNVHRTLTGGGCTCTQLLFLSLRSQSLSQWLISSESLHCIGVIASMCNYIFQLDEPQKFKRHLDDLLKFRVRNILCFAYKDNSEQDSQLCSLSPFSNIPIPRPPIC